MAAGLVNLTEGPIHRRIVAFAVPIFLGNLFQQLYNVADALIVGNFIDSNALAAVSSTGALVSILIGFVNGMSLGAGVVVAHWYGAEDDRRLKLAVHTMAAVGLACGVLLTVVGVLFTPQILLWMKSPSDVFPQSVLYLRIYFAGSLALTTYNCQVGILQSVGDSRHPLYYLIVSSILNCLLDLLLVGFLGYGVGAAALATVISQAVSSILCFRQLSGAQAAYRLIWREIRFSAEMVPDVLRNGIPAGIQHSVISIANVVVQASINTFGSLAMAGCGSYSKVQGFVFLPIGALSMAITTFVSQNRGAGQPERAKRGALFGIGTGVAVAEIVGVLFYLFGSWVLRAFSRDSEVIAFGMRQVHIECLLYFLLAFSHLSAATLRGYGKSVWPTMIMVIIWCGFRVPYILIGLHYVQQIDWIFTAYPVTWAMSSVVYLLLVPRCFREE